MPCHRKLENDIVHRIHSCNFEGDVFADMVVSGPEMTPTEAVLALRLRGSRYPTSGFANRSEMEE